MHGVASELSAAAVEGHHDAGAGRAVADPEVKDAATDRV